MLRVINAPVICAPGDMYASVDMYAPGDMYAPVDMCFGWFMLRVIYALVYMYALEPSHHSGWNISSRKYSLFDIVIEHLGLLDFYIVKYMDV